jgi:hypothetical protein
MDYAINKTTSKIESAEEATGYDRYVCPCCKTLMNLRAGSVRKKYFAHWRGMLTKECDNYVPGLAGLPVDSSALKTLVKRRMDLRLVISRQRDRAGWSLELNLPSWRPCDARVVVDVGGRVHRFDMRSSLRRSMAEPSVEPYRIKSFEGQPDPLFKNSVEPSCPGLPSQGAAAFTASGRGDHRGFPRAEELQYAGTYAFLWQESANADFPDELVVEPLAGRQGWSIALVTLPDAPTNACVEWLQSFTGLTVGAVSPHIVQVWPFLSRGASINTVEYAQTGLLLLAAHSIPLGNGPGPTLVASSGMDRLSATGSDLSPALFELWPERRESVRVGKTEHQEFERIFALVDDLDRHHPPPCVEAVFRDERGALEVVGLHRKRCKELFRSSRSGELVLEYLAVPPGISGRMVATSSSEVAEVRLLAEEQPAAHNLRQRLLHPDVRDKVMHALTDPTQSCALDFGGYGRVSLSACSATVQSEPSAPTLSVELRVRVQSFLFQLQAGPPSGPRVEDRQLIQALTNMRPPPELVPHQRALIKKIMDDGLNSNLLKGLPS